MEGTFQQGRPRTREMMKDISLPCVGVSLSLVGGEGASIRCWSCPSGQVRLAAWAYPRVSESIWVPEECTLCTTPLPRPRSTCTLFCRPHTSEAYPEQYGFHHTLQPAEGPPMSRRPPQPWAWGKWQALVLLLAHGTSLAPCTYSALLLS